MKAIGVSVKNLVQTARRKGHIDNRYVARNRAEEGSIVHRIIQKTYSEDDRKEMSVSYSWEKSDIKLIIGGRIDGILNVNTDPTIEEIKSTNLKAEDIEEPFEAHVDQA